MHRRVHARAPVRICDVGGWTDTWFAGRGRVCSVAVDPGVQVEVVLRPRSAGDPPAPAVVHALDLPGAGEHPLLDAAVAEADLPRDLFAEAWIASAVPPGAGTGTSAAVTVALLGALAAAVGRAPSPDELAAAAHRVEVERLGLQSGVQDQLAASHGGACWIEIDPYPSTRVEQVPVATTVVRDLERRLLLVLLGRGHLSTAVHERVIAGLSADAAPLEALRDAASAARAALAGGDLVSYGEALTANTAAQRALHPELVSAEAERVGEVAIAAGAAAWKVNGAGGEGGSVSVLSGSSLASVHAVRAGLTAAGVDVRPVRLNRSGLEVWVDG